MIILQTQCINLMFIIFIVVILIYELTNKKKMKSTILKTKNKFYKTNFKLLIVSQCEADADDNIINYFLTMRL